MKKIFAALLTLLFMASATGLAFAAAPAVTPGPGAKTPHKGRHHKKAPRRAPKAPAPHATPAPGAK